MGAMPRRLANSFIAPGRPEPDTVDVIACGKSLIKAKNPKAALIFDSARDAAEILGAKDVFLLAEGYVHGRFDIEGDIYSAISIKERFYPEQLGIIDKARIGFNVLRSYKRHTLRNDQAFIAHHYDHPDEFYRLFLGPSMAYSCAYFADGNDSLDGAQERKIGYLLAKLRLDRGESLLDVGCGWGSLVIKAARDWGAYAHGITLSRAQHAYANQRIQELGLSDKCRVDLLDYRHVDATVMYDKIVSIGMYEHVGERNLNAYFKQIYDRLRPDGLFVNHGITRKPGADWRRVSEARFIDKYIFPGGEIHPGNRMVEGMELAGFEVYDVESLRKHYARTLRCWVSNLERHAAEARRLVPESVYRAWVLYMAGCALTFEEGYLNIHQVSGSKTERFGGSEIAMTRAHLYQ